MKINFTEHAVDRFRERCGYEVTRPDARYALEVGAAKAARLITLGDTTFWRLDHPACVLVTKPAGRDLSCVTILGADAYKAGVPSEPRPGRQAARKDEIRAANRLMNVVTAELAGVREREKTERHRLTEAEQSGKIRRALRSALRVLVYGADRDAALAEIRAEDSGFLSEPFLTACGSMPPPDHKA